MKKNNGITLVALVITIIVLLILAGITLTLVMGENGLIAKAQEARENTIEASEGEQIALEQIHNQMGEYLENSRESVTLTTEEYAKFKSLFSQNGTVMKDRPDTWESGKEYCWQDGTNVIYGQRFTGNISTGKEEYNVILLINSNIDSIISYGGYFTSYDGAKWNIGTEYYRVDMYRSSLWIYQNQLNLGTLDKVGQRTNAPYDIWVLYKK